MKKELFTAAKVISCSQTSKASDIYTLKITWGGQIVKPGQFVMLKSLESSNPSVMPRPFSVAKYDGKSITLFIKIVGKNTRLYSMLREGDKIGISKPLGKPIRIEENEERFILVGGGMGTAALMLLAPYLCLRQNAVLLGSKKSNQLFGKETFRKMGFCIKTITEDRKSKSGFVTDLLEKETTKEKQPSVIIACGPRAMLKKVAEIAKKHSRKCLVILEEIMACGVGSCKGCAIFGKDGSVKHVCTDGPVFDANWIEWERSSPSCIKVEPRNRPSYSKKNTNLLSATLIGQEGRELKLKYPILNASGCLGKESIERKFVDMSYAGAAISKGVTINGRCGNLSPRICEVASGMLNSIGLENIGTEHFITEELLKWKSLGLPIVVNVSGFSVEEYERSTRLLAQTTIEALEVNVSCPNIDQGKGNKKIFGMDPNLTFQIVKSTRLAASDKFIIVKLSPMASDIVEIAKAAKEAGADAISVINTPLGMAIDIWSRKPKIANLYGGMSGPIVKPLAIRIIHQLYSANLGIPIIGMGGISSGEDAAEFFLAGANAIAVGTALFSKPDTIFKDIHDFLLKFAKYHGASNIQDLVGKLVI